MISISTENVSREVKKYLNRSIFNIIFGPVLIILASLLLFLLPFISEIPPSLILAAGVPLIMWPLIILAQGIVSLIFYFVNPEIMLGMWKKKKKNEEYNRNFIMGRRIQMLIVIPGVLIMFISFFIIINTLLS